MLKIAICDDMPEQLTIIEDFVKEYLSNQNIDAEIMTCLHPDILIKACEMQQIHIYILDIVMPMVNGITLGTKIRQLDNEAQIIYVTTEPNFALQSFVVNPINYLIKPVNKVQLFNTLSLAVSKIRFDDESTITVKLAEGLRIINLKSVICVEYVRHTAEYTLQNGEIVTSKTLRTNFSEYIESILDCEYFLQPHTSFVINMRKVEKFNKNCFVMRGGKEIPISAKQYAKVRTKFLDFVMG